MRPTYSVINLSNLKRNYLNIRRKAGSSIVMPVVKADAYGHGVMEVVNALNSLDEKAPEYFAVAIFEEAAELKRNKVKQPVVIFEPINSAQIEDFFSYKGLIATVFTEKHLADLKKGKKQSGIKGKIKVHVKIDTGMHRLGVEFDKAFDYIQRLNKDDAFEIDGVYSHFATSDEADKTFADLQLDRFKNVIKDLKNSGITYGKAHIANSGAILDMPESYMDMVRPGISLYGYYPSEETTESIKLKPVMSLYSEVSCVRKIGAGESVSYGRLFTAEKETGIAAVPIGYADGFKRALTNKSKAIINGEFYNVAGRVTMDRIMLDIHDSKVKTGDKVVLIGENKGKVITAWDWSNALGTIPYEITCSISKRVPRIYRD